jgi:thioredoxin 1
MASEQVLKFTDGEFEQTVLKSDKPVLVDFWAEWCGPCRMIAPAVEGLADEYDGRVAVGKLNIDENPNTPEKYGVRSIPTLLLFKDGEVVESTVGVAAKEQLAALLDKHATEKIA